MTEPIQQILFILTPILFVANLVHSIFYLRQADKHEGNDHMPHWIYYLCFCAFFGSMMFAIVAPSLPLLWVAIELTTLTSAPLIAYHRTRDALEAMWKYLLICSIGIGLALFGTMLVMHAQTINNHIWFKAGFAIILAGYGTKMGLAPFHTWLPDAHSEAPAPVSALLSGVLLNCSFLAILRVREMMPEVCDQFCNMSLMILGTLSLLVAGIFMVRQTDFKRLLAYSSVEHMGILALILGLHSKSIVLAIALVIHIVAHSFTKTMLFQIAGNLLLSFGTRTIAAVQGLASSMRFHGVLWILGILFICGMPPSALFLSELCLVFEAPIFISVIALLLLFVVFAAMSRVMISMIMGNPTTITPTPISKTLLIIPTSLALTILSAGLYLIYLCTVLQF